jgi:hypothetical protein
LQPWDLKPPYNDPNNRYPTPHDAVNEHRITLGNDPNITLVMKWAGAGIPVSFA